jgi:hypothetical protein
LGPVSPVFASRKDAKAQRRKVGNGQDSGAHSGALRRERQNLLAGVAAEADGYVFGAGEDVFADLDLDSAEGEAGEEEGGDVLGEGLDEVARFCLGLAADGGADGGVVDGVGDVIAEGGQGAQRGEAEGKGDALGGVAFRGRDADAGEELELADDDGVVHGWWDLADAEADIADAGGAEAGFEFLDDAGFAVAIELVVDGGLDDADVEDAIANAVRAGVEGEPLADDIFPCAEDLALCEALVDAELFHDALEGIADRVGFVGPGGLLAIAAPL